MSKKSSVVTASNEPAVSRHHEKLVMPVPPDLQGDRKPRMLWLWFSIILVIGVILFGFGSAIGLNLLKNVHLSITLNKPATPVPVTTQPINRSAVYAGLTFTVNNAQYATSFADDTIHSSQGIVRLNITVNNPSRDAISVIYYDVARLLIPRLKPVAPTNSSLAVDPAPGKSVSGWLDFPVSSPPDFSSLKLQLGSTALNETLVTIPFSGKFDGSVYDHKQTLLSQDMYYYFHGQQLIYHLWSVDVSYSYMGTQARAGQQYYIFNFNVSNPNSSIVSPGYGFDYIRLVLNGTKLPPVDNSLPYGFNGGAQNVGGHVVYLAPVGLRNLTLDFLVQYGSGGTDFNVTL